jgi:hypothetical protein
MTGRAPYSLNEHLSALAEVRAKKPRVLEVLISECPQLQRARPHWCKNERRSRLNDATGQHEHRTHGCYKQTKNKKTTRVTRERAVSSVSPPVTETGTGAGAGAGTGTGRSRHDRAEGKAAGGVVREVGGRGAPRP